eukprot:Gb_22863 [translate_table: standard]
MGEASHYLLGRIYKYISKKEKAIYPHEIISVDSGMRCSTQPLMEPLTDRKNHRQFYMKMKEKLNAKEAKMSQIQAKTWEEMEVEIKQLRRSLNFKVTPMPTLYQEVGPPKVEKEDYDHHNLYLTKEGLICEGMQVPNNEDDGIQRLDYKFVSCSNNRNIELEWLNLSKEMEITKKVPSSFIHCGEKIGHALTLNSENDIEELSGVNTGILQNLNIAKEETKVIDIEQGDANCYSPMSPGYSPPSPRYILTSPSYSPSEMPNEDIAPEKISPCLFRIELNQGMMVDKKLIMEDI